MMILGLVASVFAADPPVMQRDEPGEVMPDRHWDIEHLHLDLELDPAGKRVVGTARLTITPLGTPAMWLRLHQASLLIDSVKIDGAVVNGWRLGEETLDVPMPAGGGERVVEVAYHATPQLGMFFRSGSSGDQIWTQGEDVDNRYWFPGWDYPNDKFTYSAAITAPAGLRAVSNGQQTSSTKTVDGKVRTEFSLDIPIANYLVAVVVGEYQVVEQAGQVPVEIWIPPDVDPKLATAAFQVVVPQMAYFGDLLKHKYVWPVSRQVLVDSHEYIAMENPTVETFDAEIVHSRPDLFTEEVVAHELVHHWFGDELTCYGWRELWLNEGFAEYYAGRWMQHAYGDEAYALQVRGWRRGAIRDPAPLAPMALTKQDGRENGSVYDRGAMVLHGLYGLLGGELFDASIARWVETQAGQLVESTELRRLLEDGSGVHLGWLFDQFVYGGGVPEFHVKHRWNGGELLVTITPDEGSAFYLPLDLEIGGKSVATKRVWVGEGKATLSIYMAEPPTYVAVDPNAYTLARITNDQTAAEWVGQLALSENPGARLDAIRALADAEYGEPARAALSLVAGDASRYVGTRGAALEALAGHGLLAGPMVAKAMSDVDPRLRVIAARSAGSIGDVATLKAAWTKETDPEVRSALLLGLAKHAPDDSLPLARKVLRVLGLQAAAAQTLGDHGEPSDVPKLVALLDEDQPQSVRHAAVDALATLCEPLTPAQRRVAVDALVAATQADDVTLRYAAADALGDIGDDQALTGLATARAATSIPDLRDSLSEAAAAIRNHDEKPEEPATTDDKAVQDQLDELNKRVERMEVWR